MLQHYYTQLTPPPLVISSRHFGPLRVRSKEDLDIGHRLADNEEHFTLPTQLESQLVRLTLDLVKAREVQQQFFPNRLPLVEGIEVSARSQLAAAVGGDFYDFFLTPAEQLLFSIGDISSKGVSAALFMPAICTLIRAYCRLVPSPTPLGILEHVHATLYEEFANTAMFVTAFIGAYEPQSRTLHYTSAGHAPIILRQWNQPAKLIQATGAPIGVWEHAAWHQQSIRLNVNDVLVIATDGITEAQNQDGLSFGHENLIDLVTQYSSASATAIIDHIIKAVQNFTAPHELQDDQSLIVIKGASR